MNYATAFSIRVENEFFRLKDERMRSTGGNDRDLDSVIESMLYKQALDTVLAQDAGKTLAAGNLRIGEVILIVDSDTRVVSLSKMPAVERTDDCTASRLPPLWRLGNA